MTANGTAVNLDQRSARSRDHSSDSRRPRSSYRSPSRERDPHDGHRERRLPSRERDHHERRDRRSRSHDRSYRDWDREGESYRDRRHHDHDHDRRTHYDHERHTHHDHERYTLHGHNRYAHQDHDRHAHHDHDRHIDHDRDRDHERDRHRLGHEEDCEYAPEDHHKRKRGDSILHGGAMRLYIGSIECKLSKDDIQQAFEPFGHLEFVKLHHVEDPVTGRSKCYAFVQYKRGEDAKKALEKMNGSELAGRTLCVQTAHHSGFAG